MFSFFKLDQTENCTKPFDVIIFDYGMYDKSKDSRSTPIKSHVLGNWEGCLQSFANRAHNIGWHGKALFLQEGHLKIQKI